MILGNTLYLFPFIYIQVTVYKLRALISPMQENKYIGK